jgi:hypothetical protein
MQSYSMLKQVVHVEPAGIWRDIEGVQLEWLWVWGPHSGIYENFYYVEYNAM